MDEEPDVPRPHFLPALLTSLADLDFEACWQQRVADDIDGIAVAYLGRGDLIESKRIAGRLQDQADVRKLKGPGSDE